MKFGQVPNPEEVDFTIPPDHADSAKVLAKSKATKMSINIGCAKWNKADLKGFYPKGIKDELKYYSTQFNCIELNATFYRLFPATTFTKWHDTVPENFKFFPKLEQTISHFKRLKDVEAVVDANVTNMSSLGKKLGTTFLQLHNNFSPKDIERVHAFVENWKQYKLPLAVEFRHTDWFNVQNTSAEIYELLEKNKVTNVLVDTAGRRDLMHMRLTTPTAFVRWVGANHESDYARLDAWVERIAIWRSQGLKEMNFFIHQNVEKESPLLSSYFAKKLNARLGIDLYVPKTLSDLDGGESTLFK